VDSDKKFNFVGTIIVFLVILLGVYLTKDVFAPLLLSFLLAYVFYPVYRWLLNRTRRKSVSSFITMLLILSIVLVPTFGFVGILIQEISKLAGLGGMVYIQAQASILSEAFRGLVVDYLPAQFSDRLEAVGDFMRMALVRIGPIIQAELLNFITNVPLYVTYALVAAFFTYYLLIDGKEGLIDRASEIMPRRVVTDRFLMELDAIYSSLFRVIFITAAIVAVIGAVGFVVLGVPYPVLLGVLTGVASLLPMVGPPIIFVPTAIYFVVLQDYVRAFATIFFGVVFITILPNNFILPKLAQRGASIHPLITLLAFTAPLLVVGVMGMILGPAVYGFVLAAFRTWIYFREMKVRDDTSGVPVRSSLQQGAPPIV
jgi:predicted PurR-regulated permease PerM